MPDAMSITGLLSAGDDDAEAVRAPGRDSLTHAGLRAHVDETVQRLNAMGIGRGDRVGIVLPNGPEMATAFVAIGAAATTAPLNPAYRREEYEFYLSDLKAKALVVLEGDDSDAVSAARAQGVRVIRLAPDTGAPAGVFGLIPEGGKETSSAAAGGRAEPDDVALVLHTSGTTSRPKIVPLLHRNICASAKNIRTTLGLGPSDRCMNVMPLFHIHGLMACVLAPLSAGSSVFCTPGFNALKFFAWLAQADPTWYSAVPTMHQAILARAPRNADVIAEARLRFIRSSSASLPAPVMAELEETLGAPVVEPMQ